MPNQKITFLNLKGTEKKEKHSIKNNEKCITWSKDALKFFTEAEEKSITLTFVICYNSQSLTGEGFKEFINSVKNELANKIKEIVIIDTTFLERYYKPQFNKYSDPKLPSPWQLQNKETLKDIPENIKVTCVSWAQQISDEKYKKSLEQIKLDFAGDLEGNQLNPRFRAKVLNLIHQNLDKGTAKACCQYLIEECAHALAFLKNSIIPYPMKFNSAMEQVIEDYELNIHQLLYKPSKQSKKVQTKTREKPNTYTFSHLIQLITRRVKLIKYLYMSLSSHAQRLK